MKKKRQGFTLIELLAVIVILGLLLAIAIPSVTKYITQSRKKTITTTIGNYIGALTNQVNDMEYVFTEANTVYAVPIECISLERGGTDPFGEWMQANNSYWAYVLVQYDDTTSSYTYGFTFKDSAGYGLYPTTTEKLNESGKQINTDLDLTRPSNGTITNITAKDNWTGFILDDDTKLVVLEAESEGTPGDGKTTCTLCQKGKNYDKVEEDKNNNGSEENNNEHIGEIIPEGGTYYVGVTTNRTRDKYSVGYECTAKYGPGEKFPETVNTGDAYIYGDYVYRYNQYFRWDVTQEWKTNTNQGGWGVDTINNNKSSYGELLSGINGQPVNTLRDTFSQCTSMTSSPTIPNTVTNMAGAFRQCSSLKDSGMPNIPNGVTTLNNTFVGCSSLKDLSNFVIPSSVTDVYSTFMNCTSLTTAPNMTNATGITSMWSTFWGCKSITDLSSFKIPKNVKALSSTFGSCTSISNSDLGTLTIPSNVTSLSNTFANCTFTDARALKIPNSVTDIGSLFYNCKNLKDVSKLVIPNSVTKVIATFKGCTSLTDEGMPNLPNTISSLYSTFEGCTSLNDLSDFVIPNSVTEMEDTFVGCTSLTIAPPIPTSVTKMRRTFKNNTSLTTAPLITHRVGYITGLYSGCTSLTGTITLTTGDLSGTPSRYSECFSGVDFEKQKITLTGASDYMLDRIGSTGANYCTTCNGMCNGGH